MMDLDRLRIFIAIVEHGTTASAARAVHLTQPAVSRNLAQLEGALGTALFERQGRGLALTPAGRALVPRARTLLADAERVARDVRRVSEQRYYDLRVGAVDSVAAYLLPGALVALGARWPGLAIQLHTARTAVLLERLEQDRLDCAIVAYSSPPPGARVHRLGPYRARYWGRRDRFPELAEATSETDVQRLPLVELEALGGQPSMIPSAARSFAVASSAASIKAFVLAGFGVGALLDFMLDAGEREALVCAQRVPHDTDCALYLIGAGHVVGEGALEVEATLVGLLRACDPGERGLGG